MSKPILTISIDADGVTIDSDGTLTGDDFLDAAASAIAAAVSAVEQVWLAGGVSKESARQAGQCAINRSAILLRCGAEMTGGSIQVRLSEDQ